MRHVDLPPALAARVDELLADVSPRELERGAAALSEQYRSRRTATLGEADVRAYAAYRLPATYASVAAAIGAVREQRPEWEPRTVLDLGTGLGVGVWAAAEAWPTLTEAHAIDSSDAMLAFARSSARDRRPHMTWERADLAAWRPQRTYDVVLASYVLGELVDPAGLVATAWTATDGVLLVVEPGTPDGYARIIQVRSHAVEHGGFVTAPCPHDHACPMLGRDWCHFAVRLPRSARHRAAKGAELAYEDEKLSYVAASRMPTARATARVVRHPQHRRGHVYLELCADDGLRTELVSKRQGADYRRARNASWGDAVG